MTGRWVRATGALLLLVGLAALLYHPLRALPLEVWDFREFLPILEQHDGLWARWGALLDYYQTHGRMNPLFYFTFVVQFTWFGLDATGWQLLRFMVMSANVALIGGLAIRLGVSRSGAALAAALFIVATPAVGGWIQLMAEPLALLMVLSAAHLAIEFRTSPKSAARMLGIFGCLGALFLFKEVVGVLGAVVVLFALLGWPTPTLPSRPQARRVGVLMVGALLIATAAAVMILVVRSAPRATGYGMAYGAAPLLLGRLGHNLVAATMPVRGEGRALLSLFYPTNLLLLLIAAAALRVLLRRGITRLTAYAVALGGMIPLLGALVYWPWPKFDAFYALPFFLGPALLLGAALTVVEGVGRRSAWIARLAALLAIGYAAIPASRSVEAAAARIELNASLARLIGRLTPSDTVMVLGPSAGARALPVRAEELRDYAVALHWTTSLQAPTVLDAACPAYRPGEGTGQPLFVSYSFGCGRFPAPRLRLEATFAWRDWVTLHRVVDTLSVDLDGDAVSRLMSVP